MTHAFPRLFSRLAAGVWVLANVLTTANPSHAATFLTAFDDDDLEECEPHLGGVEITVEDGSGIPLGPELTVYNGSEIDLLPNDGSGPIRMDFGVLLIENRTDGDAFRIQSALGDAGAPDAQLFVDIEGPSNMFFDGSLPGDAAFFDEASLAQAQFHVDGTICIGDIDHLELDALPQPTPTPIPEPEPECGRQLVADEHIVVVKDATIQADLHSNENINLKKSGTRVIGQITASQDIDLGGNEITGNVAGAEVDITDASFRGDFVVEEKQVDPVEIPELPPFEAGEADVKVLPDQFLELPAGSYDEVKVKKRGTLVLSGNYEIEDLKLARDASILLDGPTLLQIRDGFVLAAKNRVNAEGAPADFQVDSPAKSTVKIGKESAFNGAILAPRSTVKLGKESLFNGSICAKKIVIDKAALVFGAD